MRAPLAVLTATVLLLACEASAPAQDSPLQFYSSDAAVILRLKSPDRATEAVATLVNQIQPGLGPQVQQQMSGMLGQAISNPAKIGVDDTRDWMVGVYLSQEEEPIVVFAIPAIDADDMVAALGDEMTTSVEGKWVLYTDSESIPRTIGDAHVGTLFSPRTKTAFDGGQLSLFVNVGRLAEIYQLQLEQTQEQVYEGLNALRFAAPDVGFDLGLIIGFYSALAEGVFQGISDSTAFVASMTIDRQGLGIEKLVEFRGGSESATALSRLPNSKMELMSQLPENAVVYYGLSGGAKELTRWSVKLSGGMLADEEDSRNIDEVLKGLDDIEFGQMVAALRIGSVETGLLRISGIGQATPGERFKQFSREGVNAIRNLEFPGVKQETILEVDVETFDDLTGDVMTLKQEFDEDMDPLGIQEKMNRYLFGPEGMQMRYVYLDDKYLSTTGGGSQTMKELVASLKAPPKSALDGPRQNLLAEANLLLLADVPRMVADSLQAASAIEDFPFSIDEQMIRNLNLVPSYLGFAVGTEENVIRVKTHLPVDQLTGFAKLGILFAALQGQGF